MRRRGPLGKNLHKLGVVDLVTTIGADLDHVMVSVDEVIETATIHPSFDHDLCRRTAMSGESVIEIARPTKRQTGASPVRILSEAATER